MPKIIRKRGIVADGWRLLDADALLAPGEDGFVPELPAGDVIAPLRLWRRRRDELIGRRGRLGLLLAADDAPEAIAPDLERLDLVAVRFDKFSDGRGCSLARLLRERYRWRGELRAFGDVRRDLLAFLERAGFDAFQLREGEDVGGALAALGEISVQLPAFRRSASQAA
ncbi:MAG TPA: DUF934 domain-containing protein [Burkholderiales bacterium]|nr:DUF934 domain-containing protein [Burkholderiales bacterium]